MHDKCRGVNALVRVAEGEEARVSLYCMHCTMIALNLAGLHESEELRIWSHVAINWSNYVRGRKNAPALE